MINEIKAWLDSENKDYQEGITLLTKHSKNRALIANLSRRENNSTREKLAYELAKYADQPGVGFIFNAGTKERTLDTITVITDPVAPTDPAEPTSGPVAPENPKSPIDLLVEEMQRVFNEKVQLSNTLGDLNTDEARAQLATAILAKQEQYNALAQKKNHFDEFGTLPAEPTAPATPAKDETNDKAELLQTRDNLRSQRSKAKAAVAKKPDDVLKAEKLAKIEVELQAVEAKLKLLSVG